MTLGDTPKISFSQKCRKSLRIYNYGFCFRKWRSMTLPNGPGFCFQKWRSVRYPDFWLFSTLTFNIVTWWRHTCDVTSCTYTLTDTLSATYDVTVLSPCVTSQVTKIYFWILFPWMTLGENPKMLPIWVKGYLSQSKVLRCSMSFLGSRTCSWTQISSEGIIWDNKHEEPKVFWIFENFGKFRNKIWVPPLSQSRDRNHVIIFERWFSFPSNFVPLFNS